MEAEIKKMNVEDLAAALPEFDDETLALAEKIEKDKGDKARKGALDAIEAEKAARAKGADADDASDEGEPQLSKADRLQAAADDAIMAAVEDDPRKALLSIFRKLEHIASHLNITLPR